MTAELCVLNQSQSPAFQHLIERAAGDARVTFLTGMPFDPVNPTTRIVTLPAYDRRSLARRALSWGRYTITAGARAALGAGDSFLLAVTNPPVMPHLAFALSRLGRRRRYGLLIWDIYPHHLVQQGWVRERAPLVRAWHAANRRVLANAEFVVTLGEAMASVLREELDGDAERTRIRVIPNWADTTMIVPRLRTESPLAARFGATSELAVLYAGNLGKTHGLGALIGAADALRDDPRLSFVIAGKGLGRKPLEREIRQRALERVSIHDPVPWDDLPHLLALGDVAVVSQAPGTEHLSVPSKTYSSLAAGSAILALTAPESDLARLVTEHDVGEVCAHDDADAVAAALRRWANEPERLRAQRDRARRLAEERFSASAVEAEWRSLLLPALRGGDP